MNIRRFIDTGEWTTRRYLALLGSILIWGIVAIDAWYLWPTSLHGSTSMVIVSGTSMEPTYFTGDLVIARKADPSVGDVIVYAPAGLGGSQIVHRIIGGDATEGWQLQGDNNDFVDPFTPKGDEVKGVVMVHYANFGRVTVLLLNPVVWAFLLLISIVLLVWWSGDTCEDDHDGDEDESADGLEDDYDPDLIDRVYERAEAAVSRMVASSATAGAAVLAQVTRRSAAPRHAAAIPRHATPAYLRSSAIVAVLGLLAVFGGSYASASSLTVSTAGGVFTKTYTACTTATLTAAPTGAATGTPATTYKTLTVSGIPTSCNSRAIAVYAYNSAGTLLISTATGATTGTSGAVVLTKNAGYNAAQVAKVYVFIDTWGIQTTWAYTAPPPPPPAVGKCDGVVMSDGQTLITNCTINGQNVAYDDYEQVYFWFFPWYELADVDITFNITFAQNNAQNQQNTLWRATFNLAAFNTGAHRSGNLNQGFYLYKNGNNTALAPGETCSNPSAVTFQEATPSSSGTGGFTVSAREIPLRSADLLCTGP